MNASPAELSPGERRGEEAGQEGAEQREKGVDERGEEEREMGTVCMEKKEEREGGMGWE